MSASAKEHLFALAGNPNCGKTTLFNAITGARQHVGNYPGITVEKKEGLCSLDGHTIRLVDLPGTYSLTAYSLEELVARDFLVHERPEVVINIVDASNLERNLYLTVQLLELGVPVVVALNMVDVAESRGVRIHCDELSRRLGVPVVPTVARRGEGKESLLKAAVQTSESGRKWEPLRLSYGADIDPTLQDMEQIIEEKGLLTDLYPARWTALKILEEDEQVLGKAREADPDLTQRLLSLAAKVITHIQKTLDSYPEAIIADHRYGYISGLMRQGIVEQRWRGDRLLWSDQIDRVLTNRFFGPLIMLAVLYGVYQITFTYSEIPVGWFEAAFSALGSWAESVLPEGPVRSLVISGIINGVGGVVGFVPLIFLMFLAIAFLEDTGYLARAAYMLDRVFRIFGLHGNSFMAFIISGGIAGGCAVPGVMATRTLRSSRERLATLLTAPFMNCGAKVPVLAMLIAAFFSENRAQVMFLLTLLAWIFALVLAKLLRSTILRGPSTPFLLELPPYRIPTFKGLMIHTWERIWQYVSKAGTTILAISVLLWALMAFPGLPEEKRAVFEKGRQEVVAGLPAEVRAPLLAGEDPASSDPAVIQAATALAELSRQEATEALKYSFAGRMGRALETFSRWCGFDWRTNVALVGGFAAKEVIISTLGTAYSLGQVEADQSLSLSQRLQQDPHWKPLTALAAMIFIMLYSPCFVTVTCIVKETGSWKWGLFSMAFNTTVAFVFATAVYQGGRLLGF
ncbi:ferrous iron transport protein B [Desulfacinum hydrothermale DSM 13146]|uniref:Ferrous iron transport protein B n=1 Tax=Desulfacinum hydrothermale DSM 13146 TaxID=1121390 RepID=A0A1W1X093_9BACT|nr:ferrous iron transport protein B [Desulfacinum hydrothermale]SMC17307.1 ferrous iron transport protein B [Desulfacinum hydrothermale DSM 13146]